MTGKKERGGRLAEEFLSSLGDTQFRAARIGDERAARGGPSQLRKKIQRHTDGKRDEDQIRGAERRAWIARKGFVEGAAGLDGAGHGRTVPAGDVEVGGVFAYGQGER